MDDWLDKLGEEEPLDIGAPKEAKPPVSSPVFADGDDVVGVGARDYGKLPTLDGAKEKIDDVVIVAVILLHRGSVGVTNLEAVREPIEVDGRFFDVANLRSRLSDLRKILGDSAEFPRMIMWRQEETKKGKCKRYYLSAEGHRRVMDWLLVGAGGLPQPGIVA